MNTLGKIWLSVSAIGLAAYYPLSYMKGVNDYTDEETTEPFVKTEVFLDDALINSNAITAIYDETKLKSLRVILKTKNGIVNINGFIYNPEDNEWINKKILTVSGVKGIKNNLTIVSR